MPGGAVVTGAAGGLGFALAAALAGRGYAVHLTDLEEGTVAEAAERIGARGSVLDVTDLDACRRVAQETPDLEVWVNNAGILSTAPVWEHTDLQRHAMFAVNTEGTINGTLAALERFKPAGRGHVINIVSMAGLATPPGETLYAATKHAALSFTLGTQLDLHQAGERGIHLSAVCPDGVWTPMLYDKVDDPQAAPSWSGVMFQPEEIAERAMKLLDKPRPVLVIPAWRGVAVRIFDAFPRFGIRIAPLIMADARRKQRKFKRRRAARA